MLISEMSGAASVVSRVKDGFTNVFTGHSNNAKAQLAQELEKGTAPNGAIDNMMAELEKRVRTDLVKEVKG